MRETVWIRRSPSNQLTPYSVRKAKTSGFQLPPADGRFSFLFVNFTVLNSRLPTDGSCYCWVIFTRILIVTIPFTNGSTTHGLNFIHKSPHILTDFAPSPQLDMHRNCSFCFWLLISRLLSRKPSLNMNRGINIIWMLIPSRFEHLFHKTSDPQLTQAGDVNFQTKLTA